MDTWNLTHQFNQSACLAKATEELPVDANESAGGFLSVHRNAPSSVWLAITIGGRAQWGFCSLNSAEIGLHFFLLPQLLNREICKFLSDNYWIARALITTGLKILLQRISKRKHKRFILIAFVVEGCSM